MLASSSLSRIEPWNCWCTRAAMSFGSVLRSRVMMGRSGSAAESRAISPWPISPDAPVIRTEVVRDMRTPMDYYRSEEERHRVGLRRQVHMAEGGLHFVKLR